VATLQDRFGKLEAELKRIDARTRLAFLLGGLLATADELRIGAAQIESIVKQAIAQRAQVLARMRQGERILFGPDGAPLVPGAVQVPKEVPTVKLGPSAAPSECRCTDYTDGFARPPRDDQHEPGCPYYAAHVARGKAAEEAGQGPLCAFCGLTEAGGRHSSAKSPNTWHGFRAAVTDAERESAARAAELRRSPA